MAASKSYNPDSCCGTHCDYWYRHDDSEPCWGDVTVVDEVEGEDGWEWVHCCEGHRPEYDGEGYLKESEK